MPLRRMWLNRHMGENRAKRQYTGCACRCGNGTWGIYAPGHDAKHVSNLVKSIALLWESDSIYEVTTRWRSAIEQLPSERLRWKFRRAVTTQARKVRGWAIEQMDDARWQAGINIKYDIERVDSIFGLLDDTNQIAAVAAAMGMTRHSVNMRHS